MWVLTVASTEAANALVVSIMAMTNISVTVVNSFPVFFMIPLPLRSARGDQSLSALSSQTEATSMAE